jgi:hypothetical protein
VPLFRDVSFVEQRLTVPQLTLIPTEYEQLRDTKIEHWRLGRQRHLVPAVLILTDFLLSLLIWTGSSKLQSLWGNGALSQMTTFAMVAAISS